MPKGRRCFFAGIPVPRLKGLPYIEITSESKCTWRHAWRMIMPSHRRPVAKRLLCSSIPPPQFQARWRVPLRHTPAASSCNTPRTFISPASISCLYLLPLSLLPLSRPAAACNMGNVPLPLVQAPSLCASHLQPNARSQDSTIAGRGTLRARALSSCAAAISHRSTLAACPTETPSRNCLLVCSRRTSLQMPRAQVRRLGARRIYRRAAAAVAGSASGFMPRRR